jgi:phage tail tape-measure protein
VLIGPYLGSLLGASLGCVVGPVEGLVVGAAVGGWLGCRDGAVLGVALGGQGRRAIGNVPGRAKFMWSSGLT